MLDARSAAFRLLSKIEKDHAYSNLLLAEEPGDGVLPPRDRLLMHRLVKTTLERRRTLDYNIALYLTQPLKKLKPQVLTILRMGACQLFFMDKIPPSAAVNESVRLAKQNGCGFASGLVNAVLRKMQQNGLQLPSETDKIGYCSVKYSFPPYICQKFFDYYGEETAEKIMASSLGGSPVTVRKNTLKDEPLQLDCEKTELLENCYRLKNPGNLAESPDFQNGLFHVQDFASQLCCRILSPQKGETVLDVCAAPGGKSMTLAQMMENEGRLLSCDLYEHKVKLIADTAKRLGITIIEPIQRDASDSEKELPMADRILCDVPCSGFGVTGKKPEIKEKTQEEIATLPTLQMQILETSCRFLKKGGRLVYSTCTLLPEENAFLCRAFLENHPEFTAVPIDETIKGFRDGETLTVLPFDYDCDGFFIAAFERIE